MTSFLLQAPQSVQRVRELLKPVAREWEKTTHEPVPPDMLDLVRRLG